MGERTYSFSDGTEERIQELRVDIQNLLELPEPPTEQFAISVMMCLGLGVINTARQNIDLPIQYSHPKNLREFIRKLYEMYQSHQQQRT